MAKAKRIEPDVIEETAVEETAIDETNNNENNGNDTVEWRGQTITVKRNITITEVLQFVRNVADGCFNSDTGEYMPEAMNFLIDYATLGFFTDMELPEDIDDKYNLVYCTDLMGHILPHIDNVQLDDIIDSIRKRVKHRAKSNIEALTKQMNEAVAKVASLEESLSKLFSGIDGDMLSGMVKAVANGDFSTDKIVNAVMAKRSSVTAM